MMERLSFGRPDCRRPARGRDDERVRSRHARPAGRQVPHAAVRIPVKDTILTELFVLSCQFECLTTQRVIWVGHVETYRLTLRPKCICLSTPWPLRIGRPTACADSSPARSARRWGSQLNRPSVRTATESTRSSANILPRLFLPARRRPRRAFLLLDAVPSTDSPTRAPERTWANCGATEANPRPARNDFLAATGDSLCPLPFLADLLERPPIAVERGLFIGQGLPALHDDVLRIELDTIADALREFGRSQ